MIKPFLQGLKLTFRTFFTRPVTLQYPEKKMQMFPRFRGLHELKRNETGQLICVACELCAAACPAGCIRIEPAESPAHRRFPRIYDIDLSRCIFCGFCVEACPYGAIVLREGYEMADYSRQDLILHRDQLMHTYDHKEDGPK